jgi:hypothetical protein
LAVAFDPRDGYGLKGAIDAHLSIFGHQEAVQKIGCSEWREGLPITLTEEGQRQAIDIDAKQLCGMVNFVGGYIFSCDLRNATKEEVDSAAERRAELEVSAAKQNPAEVRLMECIGVNPWQIKPKDWVPPTEEECVALKQKLGMAADPSQITANPNKPPEDVAALIKEEDELNDKCRGGSGDAPSTTEACQQRDSLYEKIKAKKWCWGHDGQIDADRVWEPCQNSPGEPATGKEPVTQP